MTISSIEGPRKDTLVPTVSPAVVPVTSAAAPPPLPPRNSKDRPDPDTVQHMLFGSPTAVRKTIKDLHKLHYAEATDWSKLMPTGRVNEVMAILSKKVRVD